MDSTEDARESERYDRLVRDIAARGQHKYDEDHPPWRTTRLMRRLVSWFFMLLLLSGVFLNALFGFVIPRRLRRNRSSGRPRNSPPGPPEGPTQGTEAPT
jgi:hypothetical protein